MYNKEIINYIKKNYVGLHYIAKKRKLIKEIEKTEFLNSEEQTNMLDNISKLKRK